MATQAGGLLAVWTDVEPAGEADFHAWYDREHLHERAANTGFRSARRYWAETGGPASFALYDLASLDAFGSPDYTRAIANPSAWSRRVIAGFRNPARMIAQIVAAPGAPQGAGTALGGWASSVRLTAGTDGAGALAQALGGTAQAAAEAPGVVRVTLALGVLAGMGDAPAESARMAAQAPTTVALCVEASDPGTLARLEADALSDAALHAAGAAGIDQRGRYRLLAAVVA